jgi:hypothetical protein
MTSSARRGTSAAIVIARKRCSNRCRSSIDHVVTPIIPRMTVPPEPKADQDTTWRAIAEARAARAEFKAARAKMAEAAEAAEQVRARVRSCSEGIHAARASRPPREKS